MISARQHSDKSISCWYLKRNECVVHWDTCVRCLCICGFIRVVLCRKFHDPARFHFVVDAVVLGFRQWEAGSDDCWLSETRLIRLPSGPCCLCETSISELISCEEKEAQTCWDTGLPSLQVSYGIGILWTCCCRFSFSFVWNCGLQYSDSRLN